MAETPQTPPKVEPKEDLKPQVKERAFYCSSPEFYVRKENKPTIFFHNRFLVTDDKDLIEHLLSMTKSLKDAAVPISIIEVSVDKIGVEPSPAQLEKGYGG